MHVSNREWHFQGEYFKVQPQESFRGSNDDLEADDRHEGDPSETNIGWSGRLRLSNHRQIEATANTSLFAK